MKKVKSIKAGVFMQDSAIQPDSHQVNFLPLRDLDYTPIVVRPQCAEGSAKKKGPQVLKVLSDQQIEVMDSRNADVEAMTSDYIMGLMDENELNAEDIGLDDETVSAILDAFEETLANFGIYINRPTIVQRDDGEHIIRSAYDSDAEFEEDEYEFA